MIARGMRYAEAASRVRVRLGDLLGARDYAALLRAAGPEQMLGQLRPTRHARAIQDGESATMPFSDALHQGHLASAARIVGFFPPRAQALGRAFLGRFAIESLKVILRTTESRVGRRRLSRLVGPLPDSDLPLERLMVAATVHDVIDVLSGTPYAEPLGAAVRGLPPGEAGPSVLLFHLELALDRCFFDRLWRASQNLHGPDKRISTRLVGALADVTNILWAERFREAFQLPPEEIRRRLLPYGFYLTDQKRRALSLRTADEALPFPFSGEKPAGADLRIRLARFLCREASRPLFMIPFQAGLPLAYLLLAEMEVSDVVTLYEGKRWSVPPETLAGRLIRFHDEQVIH